MDKEIEVYSICFLIFSFLIIFFILLIKGKLRLDERGLHKQSLFWLAIALPIVLASIASIIIWEPVAKDLQKTILSESTLKVTDKDKDNLELLQIPVAILALSSSLTFFVTSIHRTIQTNAHISKVEEQIKLNFYKNKIDSFYAHNKYMIEDLGSIKVHNFFSLEIEKEKFLKETINETMSNKYSVDEFIVIQNNRKLFSDIYEKSYNFKNDLQPKLNVSFFDGVHCSVNKINSILKSLGFSAFNVISVNKCIESIMSKNDSQCWECFADLMDEIESIKRAFYITDFLSLDYLDDFIYEDVVYYDIIFNEKGHNELPEEEYYLSLEVFMNVCDLTFKHLESLQYFIEEVLDVICNDPICNVYDNCELPKMILDKIAYWQYFPKLSNYCI
ncbi:hypothetical protein [Xenorhabdus anantnagensis]|uniref:Phage abortive infection protein n=1 Tax=Xenorhabdus anantnagensis TaxID=3025875 RepID=A0ABT5LQ53_9GAMM|nr:hypothetical protein [Xenorhabdus anantnagensis]MDC9596384.1 hypothetical protein [Xenorhabdus anantnagensis]